VRWSKEEDFNGRRFRSLKGRGNEVMAATNQGGVKATGQRLESCLPGTQGGRWAVQRGTGSGWQIHFV
jgi:hypothetical protein